MTLEEVAERHDVEPSSCKGCGVLDTGSMDLFMLEQSFGVRISRSSDKSAPGNFRVRPQSCNL